MTDAELDAIETICRRRTGASAVPVETQEDLDLIAAAHAREWLPALVGEVRRLRAKLLVSDSIARPKMDLMAATVIAAVAQEREACAEIAAKEARRLFALPNPQNGLAVQAVAVAMEKLAAAIRAREG